MQPLWTWEWWGYYLFSFQSPGICPVLGEHPYDQSSGKSPTHECIFSWPFLNPATPWHYQDSAEVKTLCTVTPGFALTIHSPRGTGFLMTYLDLLVLGLALFYISWSNCKLMNPENRCVRLPEWAELPQWTTGMELNLCLWVLFMYFN